MSGHGSGSAGRETPFSRQAAGLSAAAGPGTPAQHAALPLPPQPSYEAIGYPDPPLPPPPHREEPYFYKTQLCRYHSSPFGCKYRSRCTFAHGHHELRHSRFTGTVPGPHAAGGSQQPQPQQAATWHGPRPAAGPWQAAAPQEVNPAEVAALLQGTAYPAPAGRGAAAERAPAVNTLGAGAQSVAASPMLPTELPAPWLLHGPSTAEAAAPVAASGAPLAPPGGSPRAAAAPPDQAAQPGQGKGAGCSGAAAAAAGSGAGGSGSCHVSSTEAVCIPADIQGVLQRRFNSPITCPITLEPFSDPVVAADGNIYEKQAIEEWLYREGNDTSPLTNQPLAHKMLMPCGTMRWCMMDVVHFVTAMRRQVL
ncbi:hypothetical protein CHLNCDRAFT_133221 [Chlorella variabilis]|uniref:C3H1-type domain-containing protein n=1 Tax=Chlorella variabilis TaxID=554065 RepID=E1Z2M5_CHLVA|nr:hypothetical protein CHLNCDRAFT_133221 [Chlorella variabilis]EFN60025.1 hypothetical protein CHLNCDRAFT_133221 [Chlorella variabilis]|eukprot:XP_005852127.1 hypothetical protein CHLNCDRAFT_133221 [Chlorella variabilis]